jgi:hypothetical protein
MALPRTGRESTGQRECVGAAGTAPGVGRSVGLMLVDDLAAADWGSG